MRGRTGPRGALLKDLSPLTMLERRCMRNDDLVLQEQEAHPCRWLSHQELDPSYEPARKAASLTRACYQPQPHQRPSVLLHERPFITSAQSNESPQGSIGVAVKQIRLEFSSPPALLQYGCHVQSKPADEWAELLLLGCPQDEQRRAARASFQPVSAHESPNTFSSLLLTLMKAIRTTAARPSPLPAPTLPSWLATPVTRPVTASTPAWLQKSSRSAAQQQTKAMRT